MAYTLHPATGIDPYTVMEGREIRIKLDYNRTEIKKERDKQVNRIQQ